MKLEKYLPFYPVILVLKQLMVYQYVDGYHHRMDGLQAI
jgi:hypothetical protein